MIGFSEGRKSHAMADQAGGNDRLGEVIEYEVSQVERQFSTATAEDFGLTLNEGKGILRQLQAVMVASQMLEFNVASQVCRACYPNKLFIFINL
ncbi:hypothetical protein [Beijerinckia indica]|uniref:Uncharacterized protein n=1 Tax=Beijerinckia indica subsp. indica (strain ATCC 9039 / DSM 1715 / NCIMB 8712) TaxID=395963 RepID=B2ILF3_BEII9|nr:hypothetical protein [Beijerinckia indica]ACB97353.1 hypothetical protein Bind_3812 [Beijerinckia indica subsp. indica ATCC 9039]